jgi:anaerobic selenocysteine-containing dehydrogenase
MPSPRRLIAPLLGHEVGDPLGLERAAQSVRSERLTARTRTADRLVQWICACCAAGCRQRVYVKDERGTKIEGDPDSPGRGTTARSNPGISAAAPG